MSSVLRKLVLIGAGAALLSGLTAGPLTAASSTKKTYGVTVTPATLDYGAPSITSAFSVTYMNTTPGGIASFNSLSLSAPAGYSIDATSVSFTTTTGSSAGNLTSSPTTVTVTNLYPVTYGQSVTLSFSATVDTSNLSCATAAGAWTTYAWTGANTSGTLFALSSAVPTTTIGTDLQPGASITASGVTVTNVGTTCVPVTVSRNGNTVTILKPTIEGVALSVDILWDPEPAVLPLPVDQVEASGSATPGPVQWCGGTPSQPTVPAGQVSCLVSESSQIYGPDASGNQQVRVHDVVYLLGDYSIVRG